MTATISGFSHSHSMASQNNSRRGLAFSFNKCIPQFGISRSGRQGQVVLAIDKEVILLNL
jgi:hypothetical protein